MADTNVKQKIAEKIRDSNNILVTVNSNPSVDELSAALGITLLINKLDKHATCVFSGEVPSAMEFLSPEETFEGTVDSLRDFIIALDKEKADHLRYKVDGDVVKIFITPYRTVINQDDLDFSQGDYNVEFVIAIGVQTEDDLDRALESHGRILHDAVVASVNLDDNVSIGSLHWSDRDASSYSEMLAILGQELKTGKNLFDEQVSTAFLTGIVAATDRFSNSRTSSDVMTLAAHLMSTGANQQLIAAKLEEASEIPAPESNDKKESFTSENKDLREGKSAKLRNTEPDTDTNDADNKNTGDRKPKKSASASRDGSLVIDHHLHGDVDEVAAQVARHRQEEAKDAAEEELAARLAKGISEAKSNHKAHTSPLHRELDHAARTFPPPSMNIPPAPPVAPVAPPVAPPPAATPQAQPSFGGTLNATTEQAARDKQKQLEDERNRTILSHDGTKYINDKPAYQSPLNAVTQEAEAKAQAQVPNIFATPPASPAALPSLDDIQPPAPLTEPTLEEIDRQNRKQADAVSAVHAAFEETPLPSSQPVPPLPSDASLPPLPPLPPMPDLPSNLPPLPPAPSSPIPQPVPTVAPLPERLEETLPPLPPQSAQPPVPQPAVGDPGQFRIPGQ